MKCSWTKDGILKVILCCRIHCRKHSFQLSEQLLQWFWMVLTYFCIPLSLSLSHTHTHTHTHMLTLHKVSKWDRWLLICNLPRSPLIVVNFGGSEPSKSGHVSNASPLSDSSDNTVGVTGVSKGGGGSGESHEGLESGEERGKGEVGLLTTTCRGIGPGLRLLGMRGEAGSIWDELRFVPLLWPLLVPWVPPPPPTGSISASSTIIRYKKEKGLCKLGSCNRMASKMLKQI